MQERGTVALNLTESHKTVKNIKARGAFYQLIKKLQKDIYSDIMYPNDLRPQENHGYKTKYRG